MKSYANTYREEIKFRDGKKLMVFADWRSVLTYLNLKPVANAKFKAQAYLTAQKIAYTYTITTVSTYTTKF